MSFCLMVVHHLLMGIVDYPSIMVTKHPYIVVIDHVKNHQNLVREWSGAASGNTDPATQLV